MRKHFSILKYHFKLSASLFLYHTQKNHKELVEIDKRQEKLRLLNKLNKLKDVE